MKLKKIIFLLLIFFCGQFAFSQSNIEFQQLRGENVSTQSITYAVAQDSVGNLWIASEEGVLKHNSKFYKIYNTYDGLPELFSNRTTEIFIDSKQDIWIGLEKGVCIYNANLDVFKQVKSNTDINPSLVTSIHEDSHGNIWVGGFNGLWKYDVKSEAGELIRIVSNHNILTLKPSGSKILFGTPKGLFVYNTLDDDLQEIKLDNQLNSISLITIIDAYAIIGSKAGSLFKLNPKTLEVNTIHLKNKLIHPITDAVKNDDNSIYISTDGDGIYHVNYAFSVISHFSEDANNASDISSNGVYDILLGKENILWVATYGGGINYFDANRLPFKKIRHRFNDKNSIAANFTRSIAKDKNGNLWFGTKKGISIRNAKNKTWTHIPNLSKNQDNKQNIVLALEPDKDFMWIGTYNNGLYKMNINSLKSTHYNTKNNKLLKKVYAIHKDAKNNIWVGGIEGGLAVITPEDNIETYPIQQLRSIKETRSGNILTTGRYGVYTINPITKELQLIEALKPDKNALAYSTINSVYETNNGNLILATNGEGLVFFNSKNKSIKKLTVNSGMPSDIVQGIIPTSNSNIWASTTKGLANIIITEKDTTINVFDRRDGLANTEFNYGSYRKLSDSLFAFGGVGGVTLFNPNHIKSDSYTPEVTFDAFKLFNKPVKPGDGVLQKHINETESIILKHNENSIEIGFTGVLHSSASKIKYTHKLEGFDKTWSAPSRSRIASYTNLSPGNYTFKVKAYNKYANPGKERQLNIAVASPWWTTTAAYLFYGLLLIALIMAVIHFTSVVIKKKNADEQIDFFNNITHEIKTPLTILISSLDNVTENADTGEDSKKRIKTTVQRINSLFEQMLNFQKVTSDDALSIDISKIDLGHHLKKRINNFVPLTKERNISIVLNNHWNENGFYFDKDNFDKIILNLITNAIKYSFENGKITINLHKTRLRELKIEVIDEGLGIPKDQQKFILKRYYRARNVINSQRPGTGLGLMMVKKLLEKTGGSIDFLSEENKGTTFTVVLKNLKFEYDKKLVSKESTINNLNASTEDQAEIDAFSDSKILIVEDNDELRDVLINTLGVYFQIFEANNGEEGLKMASQIFPDLIITDLIMPEIDGMQMAKQLKDDINLNHIPVFMLTVLQNTAQKLESIESGISEYIEKPVDIKFLLAKMINTLKWQQKLREKYIHDNDADNASLFRNKNDQEFLKNLEDVVIQNIENESFSVHNLSGSFSMSRTSLYMKLKNLVDLSPQDFIIHTKLKHAKKLLIEGTSSIKEVAYRSGFSNPKYFSTSFKKFYQMTPSAFLDSLKDNI
ncbi:two-component regulator propeller domain-containing protein [Algibacter sp. 2305UL17-15]|uniref:hybrid sensor histidine kinase/response regulator transcription factor n=1 Tax=Algibacter sp. 2305UL17-15 TaxID=3231268 RepID=UPI003459F7F2